MGVFRMACDIQMNFSFYGLCPSAVMLLKHVVVYLIQYNYDFKM
jgi:hypothetical protein